jgi:hypothetical protein
MVIVDLLQRFQVQSGKPNVPLQKNHSSPNLFFRHRENGDFSILMKDILSKLVYTSVAQVLTFEHIRQVLLVLGTTCNLFSYQPGPVQTFHTRYAVLVLGPRLILGGMRQVYISGIETGIKLVQGWLVLPKVPTSSLVLYLRSYQPGRVLLY